MPTPSTVTEYASHSEDHGRSHLRWDKQTETVSTELAPPQLIIQDPDNLGGTGQGPRPGGDRSPDAVVRRRVRAGDAVDPVSDPRMPTSHERVACTRSVRGATAEPRCSRSSGASRVMIVDVSAQLQSGLLDEREDVRVDVAGIHGEHSVRQPLVDLQGRIL